MSLDVWLTVNACEHCGRESSNVFEQNITHNLTDMARAAGVYEACWDPETLAPQVFLRTVRARHLIEALRKGLAWLEANPDEAKKHDAPNGWGKYDNLLAFVRLYLEACEKYPNATVGVSR